MSTATHTIQSSEHHNNRKLHYNHLVANFKSAHKANGPPVSENVILYIQTPVVSALAEDLLPFARAPKLKEIGRLDIGTTSLHGYLSASGSPILSSEYLHKT